MKSLIILLTIVAGCLGEHSLPSQPVNLKASEITGTSVRLTWSYNGLDDLEYFIIMCNPIYDYQMAFREILRITTTDYTVNDLIPYSKYEMFVVAKNKNGRGPPSDPLVVATAETGTAPRNLIALPLSANSIKVQWDEPKTPNGQIKGYRVFFTENPEVGVSMWDRKELRNTNKFTTLGELAPNTNYTIRVQARTSDEYGFLSPPVHVKTESGKN